MERGTSVTVYSRSPEIVRKLRSDLQSLNFVTAVGTYPEVDIEELFQQAPDIILIDLTAIDGDTYAACDLLLYKGMLPKSIVPVALVSIATMRQIPLDFPFTEIVTWPCDIIELGFRLRRLMFRKHQETVDDTITIGDITLSPSRYYVTVKGQPVVFSYKEYQLFKFLITHPNRVYTREKLLDSIWGENLVNGIRTVDVHIRRIRAKIGDIDNRYIKTVRGVGYTFRYEN